MQTAPNQLMGSRLIPFFGFKFKMSPLVGDKVTHHATFIFSFSVRHRKCFCYQKEVHLIQMKNYTSSCEPANLA